jgi:hypothetical protein
MVDPHIKIITLVEPISKRCDTFIMVRYDIEAVPSGLLVWEREPDK